LQKVLADGRIVDKLTTIFLNISDEVIAERLTTRWSEDEITNRIHTAQQERENMWICDHIIDASRPLVEVKKDFFTLLWL
jgi:ribose 1,5-bisphosphokinase PhnN